MNKKQLNMEALVGTGFDCETSIKMINDFWILNPNGSLNCKSELHVHPDTLLRPRLNCAQVLKKYDWVKDVEGAVWEAMSVTLQWGVIHVKDQTSDYFNEANLGQLLWIAFKGVEAGAGLDEWAIQRGVPVIDISNNGE